MSLILWLAVWALNQWLALSIGATLDFFACAAIVVAKEAD